MDGLSTDAPFLLYFFFHVKVDVHRNEQVQDAKETFSVKL